MDEHRRARQDSRVQGLVGWAALSLVLAAAVPLGANRPVFWVFFALAILALFAAQVLVDLWRGLSVPASRAIPAALLYAAALGWAHLQTSLPVPAGVAHPAWALAPEGAVPLISADPGAGKHAVLRLVCYGLVFWILMSASLHRPRAWAFVRAIAIWSGLVAAYGLYAHLGGDNPITEGQPSAGNLTATFVNRNHYATYAVFGVLANFAVYLHKMRDTAGATGGRTALRNHLESFFGGGWIFALGGLLCLTALALTASRAGAAAGGIGLALFLIAVARRGAVRGVALWAAILGILGFVIWSSTGDLAARLLGQGGEELRFAIYREAWAGALERPLLGHGIGAFHDAFRARVPPEAAAAEWNLAHNSYLENAFELGLPAAALFYLALGLVGLRLLRGLRRRRRDVALPAFAFACFMAAGFHAFFDFSLQIPAVAALFAAILGIAWPQCLPYGDRVLLRHWGIEED